MTLPSLESMSETGSNGKAVPKRTVSPHENPSHYAIPLYTCHIRLPRAGGFVAGFSTVAISTRALADDRVPPSGVWPAEAINRGATIAPDLSFPDQDAEQPP